jgi:sugar-specific transcriptional regulator TrmB
VQTPELLRRLGLTAHEATIYASLIENGPGTVADISRRTAIHRPIVYKHLPALREKGLVTSAPRGQRTVFVPEPPERLQALLEETRSRLDLALPALKQDFAAQGNRPAIKYYEGKAGIRSVFADLVETLGQGGTFCRYSSASESRDAYLPKNYRELRDRKRLQRFVITSEARAGHKKPRLDRALKFLPRQEFGPFDFDVTQLIYGDKVAIIDYNSETATVIENQVIAEFQRQVFMALYRKI